jgi:hypothetical protein
MKSVTQKDAFGCGAACVSFISKKSYEKTISILGKRKARDKGFNCKDLTNVLLQFGLRYQYKYIKPRLKKEIYKDGAIVFIKRSKTYPAGHFLARQNGKWMDSWINFQKNKNLDNAKSGFRKRLPGRPIYVLLPG